MTNLAGEALRVQKILAKSTAARWHRACSMGFPKTSQRTREKGNDDGVIEKRKTSFGSAGFGAIRLVDRSIYGVERVRRLERFRGHLQHLF